MRLETKPRNGPVCVLQRSIQKAGWRGQENRKRKKTWKAQQVSTRRRHGLTVTKSCSCAVQRLLGLWKLHGEVNIAAPALREITYSEAGGDGEGHPRRIQGQPSAGQKEGGRHAGGVSLKRTPAYCGQFPGPEGTVNCLRPGLPLPSSLSILDTWPGTEKGLDDCIEDSGCGLRCIAHSWSWQVPLVEMKQVSIRAAGLSLPMLMFSIALLCCL